MTRARLKCIPARIEPASSAGGWKPDSVRGTRQARGYGREWERLRRQVLARDEWLCQECRRNGVTTLGTEVDHIVPKSQGGTDDMKNLELKCRQCHLRKTLQESRA